MLAGMFSWFGNRWKNASGQLTGKPSLLPEETVDVNAVITAAAVTGKDADFKDQPLKGMYIGGAGIVYVRRVEDAAGVFLDYDCDKGAYIYGLIAEVGGTAGRLTTATKLRGER